ncbi:alpha/beta hydrolase [Micromonospora sp. WMMD882]|uniref:alpha/beta hydrolase n=1 Tax=Micromonospora sp. WMMD882 TaxID=3015151 RepID=UPI00248B2960|nr:alpha/beta hydrolase [Micromonospora sp. WMMD882]WBB80902.1 alpha/beta hydrolase [Micromonospora sp. WMMD882]
MPLDPQVVAYRARRAAAGTPQLYQQTLAEARAADLAAIRAGGGDAEPVHEVRDTHVPGPDGDLPIRIHRPAGAGPLPTLVYFFGGGWTLGSVDTADGICRRLANAVPCQVITVGYRLAPEHRFPAAVLDCHAATTWIAAHAAELGVDPRRLAVGGDSAGGNLAAAVTLLARRDGAPELAGQLLVYPNTVHRGETESMRAADDPYLFNRTSVEWYWGHYLADPADGRNPLASPLLADDLGGLPPALVITAEYDPLRDEGERYAERLRDAGVPTELSRYPGMVHGFFAMSGVLDGGRRAVDQAAGWLRGRLLTSEAGATYAAGAGRPVGARRADG